MEKEKIKITCLIIITITILITASFYCWSAYGNLKILKTELQTKEKQEARAFESCLEQTVDTLLSFIQNIDPESKVIDLAGRQLTLFGLISDKASVEKSDSQLQVVPSFLLDLKKDEIENLRVKDLLSRQGYSVPFDSFNERARVRAKMLILTQEEFHFLIKQCY